MTIMRDEILEQAGIVARLAGDLEPYRAAAAEARAAGARFVLYAARGTSDNAAVYGKYLATILAGLPAGLAVPSAATVYGAAIDFRDCLVVGISQSGETPDVAEYVAQARAAGAYTLAITNYADSLLARAAHGRLATGAGRERAVAATKTYTSQLAALALFWAAWTGEDRLTASLAGDVPAAMEAALAVEDRVVDVAARLSHADRLLVTGREGEAVLAEANYTVVRTRTHEPSELLSVGRSYDRVVREDGELRFAARVFVFDNDLIPNSVIYPICFPPHRVAPNER